LAHAEWAKPMPLDEDEPRAAHRSEEPVALGSLEGLLEDRPLLASRDVSDPSAWARAIVDTAFGPTDEEKAAARSLEEAAFGPADEPAPGDSRETNRARPASRPASVPDTTSKARVDEVLALVQELAGRTSSLSGRPWLASSLFAGCSRARLLAVVRDLRVCRFSAGDVILTEGEAGTSLFLIAQGSVKVFVRSPHGRSFEVGRLQENEFFGEVSVISGRPRTASIVASAACELLEIRRETLESLLAGRRDAHSLLEEACVARATSPAAAAVRALPMEAAKSRERAHAALATHFGDTQWSLRMRLRLAEVLLKAGNEDDAVAILTSVADALAAADDGEKALAVLQKIATVRRRHVEELCLAPLAKEPMQATPGPGEAERHSRVAAAPEGVFRDWLVNMLREVTAEDGTPPLTLH
jgi:Cyclic nucleotide-binding domain